jgi:hypothetical protein
MKENAPALVPVTFSLRVTATVRLAPVPGGTVQEIAESDQLGDAQVRVPTFTLPVLGPKFVPVMVSAPPVVGSAAGVTLERPGTRQVATTSAQQSPKEVQAESHQQPAGATVPQLDAHWASARVGRRQASANPTTNTLVRTAGGYHEQFITRTRSRGEHRTRHRGRSPP